ncbi:MULTISPECIES: hypothetical protein [Prevotellaceae]|uniref:hypothetical protein n=1 Tax=Prevotellaceae TaxID=171552 RepID=UPI0003D32490|nr:hypothetical protein [Prevotella phocaeensis]ETD19950.1 hypothetical protein HMPREF1199_00844 [Hoylesella oralis CC98A]
MKRLITESATKIIVAIGMIAILVFIAVPHNSGKFHAATKSEQQMMAKMQWFFVRTSPTVVVNSQEKADSILQERGRLWLAANKNE